MQHVSATLPRTRRLLERGIADGLHPGAQLHVRRGGAAVADLALGEARPGEPMTGDHLMPWLSSSKPVGAVAIARLWEGGQLALDDPVVRHLPEFGQQGKERITLRHLLTHTAGIRMLDVGWPRLGWQEILERICASRSEPGWVPGERAGYDRAASWFVLGEIVRRLDGRPFERFAREEIFQPLGMDDCWIGMPAERYREYAKRLAPLWNTAESPPRPHGSDGERQVTRCAPGGNGHGPMRQLARFYQALLNGGELDGHRLLTPQTVEALTARHRVGMEDRTFRHPLDWGLGFIPNPSFGAGEPGPYGYGPCASRRAVGHSGYRSSTAFADPEHSLVVALAVNGTPDEASHRRRFHELLGALYEDLGLAPARDPERSG